MMGAKPLIAVIAAGLVTCSCGGSPTAPREDVVHFLYIEGRTVVAPGETAQVTAIEMRTGHGMTNVTGQGQWGTSNSSVATVQQGLLRGVFPGQAIVSVARQGLTGTADVHVALPSAAPAIMTGYYSGTLTYTSCLRPAGAGPSLCRDRVGRPFSLQLALAEQQGARVAGTLRILDTTEGPVSGYLEDDGHVSLSGVLRVPDDPLAYIIRHLRVRLDGGRLIGQATADYALINAFGPQLLRHTFDVEATLQ
jgi:hypothetical protein